MTDDQCQLARSGAVNTRRPPGRPDYKPVRTPSPGLSTKRCN